MKKQFLIGLIVMVVAASGVVALWAQDDTAPPYLGIAYQPDGLSGLFVTNVQDDSPAAEAGLRAGDILVALDQSAVSVMNIQAVLSDYTPGDTVTLIVQRGDEALSLELTLTERPDDFTAVPDIPDMPDLPEEFRFEAPRPRLGIAVDASEDIEGVEIINVVEDSPADEAGLEQGDIITAVDGEAVTTPTELVDVVSATEPGDTLTLTVERDGETLEIESTVEMSQPESFIVPDEDSADAVDDDDLLDTLDELQLEEPRPRLGIAVDTNAFNGGVAIINVVEGSPADDAGLLRGDVITAVDGEPISTPTALIDIVAAAEPDQTLTLTIERDNETLEVEATVEMGHAGTYFHHNDEREDDN